MAKYSEYKAAYYQKHKERLDKKNIEWAKNNPDSIKLIKSNYRSSNLERIKDINLDWYLHNKTHKSSYSSEYKKNNKAKINAIAAKRRAAKLQATPKWLTDEHFKEIEELYILAKELAWLNQDGQPFHVDHIIPLQGPNYSGLHVPWNLQLIPAMQNYKKGNK